MLTKYFVLGFTVLEENTSCKIRLQHKTLGKEFKPKAKYFIFYFYLSILAVDWSTRSFLLLLLLWNSLFQGLFGSFARVEVKKEGKGTEKEGKIGEKV